MAGTGGPWNRPGLVKGKRGSSQIQGLDNGGHDVINLRDDIRTMDTSKKLKE